MAIIIVDQSSIFQQLIEFASLALGWFSKGLVLAIASEIIFRPIARRIKAQVAQLEHTHPIRYQKIMHHFYNHMEPLGSCQECG